MSHHAVSDAAPAVIRHDVPAPGSPAAAADPTRAADVAASEYVARAQDAGLLSDTDSAALQGPLAERLCSAETVVDAEHRAERAVAWARLAARRHAFPADIGRPSPG